ARLAELTGERGGAIVLNADDAGSRDLGARLSGDLHWYGVEADGSGGPALEATEAGGQLVLSGVTLLRVGDVPLPGAHMHHDVLAAALAARLVGATTSAIAEGIRSFQGVPHRLETIAEADGVRWINDSQATIPAAAIAALVAFAP